MFRDETTSKRGGANNPDGCNQHKSAEKGEEVKADNVSIDLDKPEHGNSKAYTNSRLSKQNPELFAKVVKGEMSANQAAIEAGFRKRTITVPVSVKGVTSSILNNFSADQVQAIVKVLQR